MNISRSSCTVIDSKSEKNYWHELIQYKELFYYMVWRDTLIRYKETVIGVLWSVLRPLLTMVVLTIVFSKLAKMPVSPDVPYPLLVLAGLLPWQLFSNAVQVGSDSIINNAHLVSKVYFPRLILPMAGVMVTLVDFLIALFLCFLLMFYYQIFPSWRIVFLPAFLFMAVVVSSGISILFASLNVLYRDFRHVLPFLLQFGLYVTPVGFSSSVVPEKWRLVYSLNPIVGVIDGFRWALLGEEVIYWPGFCVSVGVVLFAFWLGINTFRSVERLIADRV